MDGSCKVRRVDLGERDDREDDQHQILEAQQEPLQTSRYLNADGSHSAHDDEEQDAGSRDPQRGVGQPVGADQVEEVHTGDLRQAGHDDDVGRHHDPAGDPTRARPHGSGDPAERGAAVWVYFVEVVVGTRDEDHRDERDDHDRGRLEPDPGYRSDQPQGHG